MSQFEHANSIHITPSQQIALELANLDENIQNGEEISEYLQEARAIDEQYIRTATERGDIEEFTDLTTEQRESFIKLGATLMKLARVRTINTFQKVYNLKKFF